MPQHRAQDQPLFLAVLGDEADAGGDLRQLAGALLVVALRHDEHPGAAGHRVLGHIAHQLVEHPYQLLTDPGADLLTLQELQAADLQHRPPPGQDLHGLDQEAALPLAM